MPNVLTGEYDAVVQMSVPRINRLLASLHQEEVFAHSVTLWVDTLVLSPDPGRPVTAASVAQELTNFESPAPAAAQALTFTAYSEAIQRAGVLQVPRAGIAVDAFRSFRAQAEVQASTPTVTLPPDPTARKATVHFQMMAQVTLQPGSIQVPEFLHGEVQLTLDVVHIRWQGLGPAQSLVLDFDIATADMDVRFVPAPGTLKGAYGDAVVAVAQEVIANVMRDGFQWANRVIDIPPEVRHLELKTIGGAAPAAALLLNLPPPPDRAAHGLSAGARVAVNATFVDPADDFGIAVSGEFIIATLEALIDQQRKQWVKSKNEERLRNAGEDPAGASEDSYVEPITVNAAGRTTTIDYIVSFTGRTIVLEPGAIKLTMYAHGHHDVWWIVGCLDHDIDFEVTQRLRLVVDSGIVRLEFIDPLEVTGFEGKVRPVCTDLDPKQLLTDQIGAIARPLLKPANATLAQLLGSINFGAMLKGLQLSSIASSYRAAEIRSDAIVLRGTLTLPAWKDASVISHGETVTRGGTQKVVEDALESWIPGGTVTSYRWYGAGQSVLEDHRFMTFIDPAAGPVAACLEIVGTQTTDTGETRAVKRHRCRIFSHVFGRLPEIDVPNVPRAIAIPRVGPDPLPDAYIDPWAAGVTAQGAGASTLIHFAGEQPERSVAALERVLSTASPPNPVSAIVVTPAGTRAHTLRGARSEGEARSDLHPAVAFAEDVADGWSRTFRPRQRPTTLLVGPSGDVRWLHEGDLNSEDLSGALREHCAQPGTVEYRPLALPLSRGDRAPDFIFEFSPGRRMPLHTLRGRPIEIVFWTSWAEPSLIELQRVARRHAGAAGGRTFVLAINDGEPVNHAREVFERHSFDATFVPDPERAISRLCGVHCWPTVVSLDERGRVVDVQMGRSHDDAADAPHGLVS